MQFAYGNNIVIHRFSRVTDKNTVDSVIELAKTKKGVIVHTIVLQEIRKYLIIQAQKSGIVSVDLIGSLITEISQFIKKSPIESPGITKKIDSNYFKKIEAIDFTVQHDDGRHVESLNKADIVLVGVSRTSKTPVAMYLSHQGFKVANIPVALGIEPPMELFHIDRRKVIALTISLDRLKRIREERVKISKLKIKKDYFSWEYMRKEKEYFEEILSNNEGWYIIDVTQKSVEETANIIMLKIIGSGI